MTDFVPGIHGTLLATGEINRTIPSGRRRNPMHVRNNTSGELELVSSFFNGSHRQSRAYGASHCNKNPEDDPLLNTE